MDYRRWSQRAEWGLVAAVIGLHATVFFWLENPSQPNFLLTAAHDAQLLSAIVLIIGWVVLGPGYRWIRLAASPVLVGLWFLPWNSAMLPRQTPDGFIATFVCAAAVLIGGLRLIGLRITKLDESSGPERGAQFSLLGLIVATTAIAVSIGLLEALRPTLSAPANIFQDDFDVSTFGPVPSARIGQQVRQLVIGTTVALAAVGGVWAVLRPGAIWLRLAALAMLVPAAAVYLSHVSGEAGRYLGLTSTSMLFPNALSLASGLAAVAALCGVSVLPLRLMDYRLQRPARQANQLAAQSMKPLRLAERVAAIFVLGITIGIVYLNGQLQQTQTGVPGRINILTWVRVPPADQVQPPLDAFSEWIDSGFRWSDDLSIIWSDDLSIVLGSGQGVHPQPLTETTGILLMSDGELRVQEVTDETVLKQP